MKNNQLGNSVWLKASCARAAKIFKMNWQSQQVKCFTLIIYWCATNVSKRWTDYCLEVLPPLNVFFVHQIFG